MKSCKQDIKYANKHASKNMVVWDLKLLIAGVVGQLRVICKKLRRRDAVRTGFLGRNVRGFLQATSGDEGSAH